MKKSNCCQAPVLEQDGEYVCLKCKEPCDLDESLDEVPNWEEKIAMKATDIIFNRGAGWSKKLEDEIGKILKQFIKDKMKEMADEMIGEHREISDQSKNVSEHEAVINDTRAGYNAKRDEIIKIAKKYI